MADSPFFWKDRHIKYFLRCLKTFLPHQYTPNDANRMTLAFFVVAGLDLLGYLHTGLSASERQGYIDWVYHCQVHSGGFRGFTGTDFGDAKRTSNNECWDPANLPATFFALVTLLILGDDLARVKREDCLNWLQTMQRADGSFGEVLGPNGEIAGGRDLRFCCCAAGIRYILRGKNPNLLAVDDIDSWKLRSFVCASQTYDGGFAQAPGLESHAGLTYCGLGALHFLDHPEENLDNRCYTSSRVIDAGELGDEKFESLVRWLVFRQTNLLYDDNETDDDDHVDDVKQPVKSFSPDESTDEQIHLLPFLPEASQWPIEQQSYAGFNGRTNKISDTCYCFWVTGSLALLHRVNVIDAEACKKYLLEKTQHLVGGFGKGVGELPDVLHSYLGLASLSLLGEPEIDRIDPAFCTSKRARQHLESLPWWKGQ
ncbi:geranylgeranyl transferase type-1 subunit beta [Ophidiomyces ophidiicola]|uniref:Geranylgeranyl transferase type-1 subunit beta n=1 Tax=Ophidiomyces ophidiicola TaxID=1387563 RepID=A0ACB8UT00_9EURO|nr:geranylgeranyl transferase type-1 subunit beta [Ophidiomyces ophidiicola]KAI1909344.1 geranylgeranyl transferase type-1 subunit beta [Ophidiomyces ophidiicola]KAI1921995.1 geranylgeranyl transferase type-1 subunit beta [Ophidiomyces ophidiicola]KAI2006545.1 geranylgeranyl transferase type-1 subunit beta [Ophidiomyces ophidiicola]KAI2016690.1 geranylgeranyl transferase type-1 subunit beta [Ophidiomyces ophidiicola]